MPGGWKALAMGLALVLATSPAQGRAQVESDRPACGAPREPDAAPTVSICRDGEGLALEPSGFPARSADGRLLVAHAATETAAGVTLSVLVFFDAATGHELGRLELGRFEEMLALGHGHAAAEESAHVIEARVARALAILRPMEAAPVPSAAAFHGASRPCRDLSPREAAREACATRARIEAGGHVVEARFSEGSYVVLVDARRLAAERAPRIVREGPGLACHHPGLPLEASSDGAVVVLRFGFLGDDACWEPGDVYRVLPLRRGRPARTPTRELRLELEALRRGRLPWEAPLEDVPRRVLLALLAGQRAGPLAEALLTGAERALARDEAPLAEALAASARLVRPDLPEARYALARALAVLGRPSEAVGELRALSLDRHAGRRLLDRARSEADFAPLRTREDGRALLGAP